MRFSFPSRSAFLTGFIVLAVLVSFLLVTSEDGSLDDGAQPDSTPMVVQTLVARPLDSYSVERRFVGRIEARRESRLGFELPGTIELVAVEDGSEVKAGALIARLDTQLLEARKQELIAASEQAAAALSLAQSTRTRVREANSLDAVSGQIFDESETGYANAQAIFNAAESAVNTLSVQIQRSQILAPFAGTISRRYLDEGQVISPGEPIVRLLESARPQVRLAVSSQTADQLAVGKDYPISIGGNKVVGTLAAILKERQAETRGVEVLFDINASFIEFRSGDTAEIVLSEAINRRGFRLPVTALTESARGIWAVYAAVQGADGFRLDRRQVELLHHDGGHVIVRGTLAEGDSVVTEGLHRLMPGQLVRPIDQTSGQTASGARL